MKMKKKKIKRLHKQTTGLKKTITVHYNYVIVNERNEEYYNTLLIELIKLAQGTKV